MELHHCSYSGQKMSLSGMVCTFQAFLREQQLHKPYNRTIAQAIQSHNRTSHTNAKAMQSNESMPTPKTSAYQIPSFQALCPRSHVSVYVHAKYHTRSTILRENLVHYMQVHVSLNLYTMEIFQNLAQFKSLSDQSKLHHI